MDPRVRTYWLRRAAARRSPPPPRSRPRSAAFLLTAALFGLFVIAGSAAILLATGARAASAWYGSFVQDFPSVSDVDTRSVFKNSRILDRDGDLLYELFDVDEGKRTIVRLADMPRVVVDAFLAVEDASFYDNPGIEPRGIARALWQNLQAGTVVSGGSTITQQLIRNVLLDRDERTSETLDRKMKEAVLALELSAHYRKEQILEWYLNEIYFGNLSYGVAAAAGTYFNKPLDELTLAEAALLAGLPQAPVRYDPFKNFDAAKARQREVLELMAHHRFVARDEAERAMREALQITPGDPDTIRYPHWVFYVRSVLEEMYGRRGLLSAGVTVHTTIDPTVQQMAEQALALHRPAIVRQAANNAALVAIDPWGGEVLAMVGSLDYYDTAIDGQVNNAVTLHQPGSAIKPLVYLTAFLKGFSPSTVVQDAPITLPDASGRPWRPQNHDNQFRGAVTLRRALGNSLNIPAVKVLQFAGLEDTIGLAKRFGMTSLGDPSTYGLSFTLGGADVRLIELATAYVVLANGGTQVPVSPILKIVDGEGRVVFQHRPLHTEVVDPRTVYMVNSILSDNSARTGTFGANSPLRLANDRPAVAKTGTTDLYRDTWAMGYTPSLVAGVWVGRTDNAPTRFISGSNAAPLIWNSFMERALADWPHEPFEGPPGLVQDRVCAHNGLPGGDCAQVTDWFLEERAPSTLARIAARALAIDRATGQLADRDTPYTDIDFRRFRAFPSGDGPFPPAQYSERVGISRPWEALPPTLLPTIVPPTPAPSPVGPWGPGELVFRTTPLPLQTAITAEATATPRPATASAAISSPLADEAVSGRVPVVGTAWSPRFSAYRLEYQQLVGGQWSTLREITRREPVQDGRLEEWDTSALANGWYSLLLTVVTPSGVDAQTRIVLTVQNRDR